MTALGTLILVSAASYSQRFVFPRASDDAGGVCVNIKPGRNTDAELLAGLTGGTPVQRRYLAEAGIVETMMQFPAFERLTKAGRLTVERVPTRRRKGAPADLERPPGLDPDDDGDDAPEQDPDDALAGEPMPWTTSTKAADLRRAMLSRDLEPGDMTRKDMLDALEAWDETHGGADDDEDDEGDGEQ